MSTEMATAPAWHARHADQIKSATEAIAHVRHGDRVFIGSNASEPQTLVEALCERKDLIDTEIIHILTLGVATYADPTFGNRFRPNSFFIGANMRDAISAGRADYTPIFLSELPNQFREGRTVIDVALITVSPPDEHGYFSYGVSCDVVKAATESAKYVIAEVNQQMPRVLGDNFIHAREIDALVPSDRPILELNLGKGDATSQQIARNISLLIEDGSTLQLGIGAIPDAVLHHLDGFQDLGIHTEMFSDGIIPLVHDGTINNSRKTLHRGKIISSFAMGTRKLYDFVNDNPLVEFHPSEYTNDPFVIAQNDKMIAINGAIEVDITGQVCADSIGTRFYSGIGGQVDFIRGAARSRGGKPIIALPATAKNGSVSRIVPTLKPGAGVVTSRGDVHYVVTEFGTAFLHGKSIRERAMALIQIADPKFRPWLLAEAKERHLVYLDQQEMPFKTPTYPASFESWFEMRNGERVFVRPLKLNDEPMLREMFYDLSEETIHYRFFHMIKSLPHEKLQDMLKVDYEHDMALVVLTDSDADGEMVGIAHYSRNPATNYADAAFLVRDDYQNQGIGTMLITRLAESARMNGIAGFTAEVLLGNQGMMRVFHKCGYHVDSNLDEGIFNLRIPFKQVAPA